MDLEGSRSRQSLVGERWGRHVLHAWPWDRGVLSRASTVVVSPRSLPGACITLYRPSGLSSSQVSSLLDASCRRPHGRSQMRDLAAPGQSDSLHPGVTARRCSSMQCVRGVVHHPTANGWAKHIIDQEAALAALAVRSNHLDRPGTWHSQHAGQDRVVATLLTETHPRRLFGRSRCVRPAAAFEYAHARARLWMIRAVHRGERTLLAQAHVISWRRCCVAGAAVADVRAEMGFHFYGHGRPRAQRHRQRPPA